MEIKPCPFCGGKPIDYNIGSEEEGTFQEYWKIIHKSGCYLENKTFLFLKAEYDYKDWNTRNSNIEIIETYTQFLLDHGYCDDDVWCEEPKAIDRFIYGEGKPIILHKNKLTNIIQQ